MKEKFRAEHDVTSITEKIIKNQSILRYPKISPPSHDFSDRIDRYQPAFDDMIDISKLPSWPPPPFNLQVSGVVQIPVVSDLIFPGVYGTKNIKDGI